MSSQSALIVTKFGYRRGGAEAVAIDLASLLHTRGWRVGIFTMDYPANDAPPPGIAMYTAPEIHIDGALSDRLRGARRVLGGAGVAGAFRASLTDFRPDIVHFHNIHSYLSPEVVRIASEEGIPTVWTLHDYKLLCPTYSFLRGGAICEECLTGTPMAAVRHRCMKRSLAASLLAGAEMLKWRRSRLEKWTDAFICPSAFMAAKMSEGGFDVNKLHTLCNFTTSGIVYQRLPRKNFACYVGRLSEEKGIDTLLRAVASQPSQRLRLAVAGNGPLAPRLHERYGRCESIQFLGRIGVAEVGHLLSEALFSVVPSEWYENNPLSLIESLSAGTPVVGASIGGIPELIGEGDGLMFTPGNVGSLQQAMSAAASTAWDHDAIAARGAGAFSPDRHYRRLMEIYRSVMR